MSRKKIQKYTETLSDWQEWVIIEKQQRRDDMTKGREYQRTYNLSADAYKILEDAKNAGMTKNDFVSKCVEDYGPVLLQKLAMPSLELLKDRLDYLEAAIAPLTYAWILGKLEKKERKAEGSIKAHQDIIRISGAKNWLNLEKIRELAQKDSRTQKTPDHVWQTLIRRRERFFNEDVAEDDGLDG